MSRLSSTKLIIANAITLVKQGWIQGAVRRESKRTDKVRYCAMGALFESSRSMSLGVKAMRLVEKANDIELLIEWNDQPGRRKHEIISALKKTIESIERPIHSNGEALASPKGVNVGDCIKVGGARNKLDDSGTRVSGKLSNAARVTGVFGHNASSRLLHSSQVTQIRYSVTTIR